MLPSFFLPVAVTGATSIVVTCLFVLVSVCFCAPRNIRGLFFFVCSLVTRMLDWVTGVLCSTCSLWFTLDFYFFPNFWKCVFFSLSLLVREAYCWGIVSCKDYYFPTPPTPPQSLGPQMNYFCIFFSEEMPFLLSLMLQVLNSRIMPKLCMDHCELS